MATKPSSLPLWATTGADVAEPTTGRKQLGWVHGESPTAQEMNWLDNLIYQWLLYLSDGALSGNHSVAGTFSTTGAATLGAAVTATGTITANGGVTVPSGQTLDVNGVADLAGASSLKLPSRTMLLDVSSGMAIIGGGSVVAGFTASTTPTALVIPVPLHAGDRITGIKVFYERNSGSTIGFSLVQIASATDTASNLVSKNVSTGTGAASTELQTSPTSGSLPQTLATGNTYRIRADVGNADKVVAVEITCDRP